MRHRVVMAPYQMNRSSEDMMKYMYTANRPAPPLAATMRSNPFRVVMSSTKKLTCRQPIIVQLKLRSKLAVRGVLTQYIHFGMFIFFLFSSPFGERTLHLSTNVSRWLAVPDSSSLPTSSIASVRDISVANDGGQRFPKVQVTSQP